MVADSSIDRIDEYPLDPYLLSDQRRGLGDSTYIYRELVWILQPLILTSRASSINPWSY